MLKRLITLILLFPFFAFAEDFVQGKDYLIIPDSKPSQHATVTEFFSYGCPWCYRLEPSVDTWLKQSTNTIKFSRVPVIFHKDWLYYAKAYYAASLLHSNGTLDPLLFKAIQTDKLALSSNQTMIDFFVQHGISKDIAESAFLNSTTVDMKINEGNQLMGLYQINTVPAFVVNHHYKTDLQMAQNEERLFKILNYLLSQKASGTVK